MSLLSAIGIAPNIGTLNIIIPVGISFYTFQTLSYTIDIYRDQLKPTKNFFDFALFVSFFPQLVAGPIERAKNLLPQLTAARTLTLNKFYEGSYLIFWGLVQKIVIADNLGARIVDPVFSSGTAANGVFVLIAIYAFAIQIFCDFAGYSNIARGVAKCLGIELMDNFKLPYFAANPSEFWRRWHISLSSWFRDYLYIPLGGNRRGRRRTLFNVFIVMVLCGLWHGPAWTFVAWGIFHASLLIVYRQLGPIFSRALSLKNIFVLKLSYWGRVFLFFNLTCFGWLLFRSESIYQAGTMFKNIFTDFNLFSSANFMIMVCYLLFFGGILFVVQIIQNCKKDLMYLYSARPLTRILFYLVCFYLIIIYGYSETKEFIYFQF